MTKRKLGTVPIVGKAMIFISSQWPMAISQAAIPSVSTHVVPSDIDTASSRLLASAEPFEELTEMAFSALAGC